MNRLGLKRFSLTGVAVCAGMLFAFHALAGDLTTDGLTVKQDAEFRGPVELVHLDAPSAYPTNSLVAYYAFRTNGNGTVSDLSPEGNDGTVSGASWVSNGVVDGGAITFDGSDDYVTVPDDASLDVGTSDFTIGLWFKGTDTSDQGLLSKGAYTTAGYKIEVKGPNLGIDDYDGSSHYREDLGDSGASLDGEWHHFAATHDRDGLATLYLDGEPVETLNIASMGNLDSSVALYLGKLPNGKYYAGALDEVLIYKRLLSSEEVSALYDYALLVNTNGGHLVAESAAFSKWVTIPEAGDISMGTYTNAP